MPEPRQLLPVATAGFARWYARLDTAELMAVHHGVELLAARSGQLTWPYDVRPVLGRASAVRELRLVCDANPLRFFYAASQARGLLLLLGGDRTVLRLEGTRPGGLRPSHSVIVAWAHRAWRANLAPGLWDVLGSLRGP